MPIGECERQPGGLFALPDKNLIVGIDYLVIGGRHRIASSRPSGEFGCQSHHHIASCPSIETVSTGEQTVVRRPRHPRYSKFLRRPAEKRAWSVKSQ
jgi:hypothetical protein